MKNNVEYIQGIGKMSRVLTTTLDKESYHNRWIGAGHAVKICGEGLTHFFEFPYKTKELELRIFTTPGRNRVPLHRKIQMANGSHVWKAYAEDVDKYAAIYPDFEHLLSALSIRHGNAQEFYAEIWY